MSANVAGTDTPQLYLTAGPKRTQQRLLGWSKVALKPGEARMVTVTAPARMLANWDIAAHGWRLDGGGYQAGGRAGCGDGGAQRLGTVAAAIAEA